MSVLPIKIYGEQVLREKAAPVEQLGEEDQRLIDDMIETMHAAPGIGLAATQVGVAKRIAVLDLTGDEEEDNVMVLVNPEIHDPQGECMDQEGCLSLPEIYEDVARPERLTLKALDRHGEPFELEAEGLLARAVCHEIDHLDGRLIVDYISSLKRSLIKKKMKKRLAPTA